MNPLFNFFLRVATGKALDFWASHGGLGIFTTSVEVAELPLLKCTMRFDHIGDSAPSTRDLMLTSIHFLKVGVTDPGEAFEDSDVDSVGDAVEGFWTAIKPLHPAAISLTELRFYNAGPDFPAPQLVRAVRPIAVAGTSSGLPVPPQCSTTLTLQTASRKHWGRLYLPPMVASQLTGSGRLANSNLPGWVDPFVAMAAATAADDIVPVVWSPASGTALGITAVSMDDVVDVQRSRRFATVKNRYAVSA